MVGLQRALLLGVSLHWYAANGSATVVSRIDETPCPAISGGVEVEGLHQLRALALQIEDFEDGGWFEHPHRQPLISALYVAILKQSCIDETHETRPVGTEAMVRFIERALSLTPDLLGTLQGIRQAKLADLQESCTSQTISDFNFIRLCLEPFVLQDDFVKLYKAFPLTLRDDILAMVIFASLHARQKTTVTLLLGTSWPVCRGLIILATLLRDRLVLSHLHIGDRDLIRWSKSHSRRTCDSGKPTRIVRSLNTINWPHARDRMVSSLPLLFVMVYFVVLWAGSGMVTSRYL